MALAYQIIERCKAIGFSQLESMGLVSRSFGRENETTTYTFHKVDPCRYGPTPVRLSPHLQPVAWSISLGCDPAGRLPAVAAAVRQGRITREVARSLLGPELPGTTPMVIECAKVAGLLAGKDGQVLEVQTTGARRFLDAVRDGLRQADERLSREQAARELEREAARAQVQAKKAEALRFLYGLGGYQRQALAL